MAHGSLTVACDTKLYYYLYICTTGGAYRIFSSLAWLSLSGACRRCISWSVFNLTWCQPTNSKKHSVPKPTDLEGSEDDGTSSRGKACPLVLFQPLMNCTMASSLAFTSLQRANRVKSLMVGLAMLTEIFHLGAFVSQLLVVGCGAFSTQSTSTAFYQKHDRSLLFRLKSVGNTHGMDSDPKAMLKDMNQRLEILQTSSPAALSTFFEPALLSFSVKPGSTERMSITSTCYALRAIQATDDRETVFNSLLAMDARIGQVEPGDPRTPVQSILKALLDSEYWRTDDLFQVPLLLHTLLSVDKDRVILSSKGMDEATANRIRQLLTAILGARPRRRDGNEKALSDYIIFELTKVYALLYEVDDIVHGQDRGNDLNTEEMASDDMLDEDQGSTLAGLRPSVVPDGFRSQLPLALSRCAESSSNELSRQVALHFAGGKHRARIGISPPSDCSHFVLL